MAKERVYITDIRHQISASAEQKCVAYYLTFAACTFMIIYFRYHHSRVAVLIYLLMGFYALPTLFLHLFAEDQSTRDDADT